MSKQLRFDVGLGDLAPAVRIREVALRLFGEHGPAGTSIRMVAAAAGVSIGAILHHYKSKDVLEKAVLDTVIQRLKQAISGVGLSEPTVAALQRRREVSDEFFRGNPAIAGYVRHVYLEGGRGAARVFKAFFELQKQQMTQMMEAGLARPLDDPEIGIFLYQVLSIAPVLLAPLLEQVMGLDLDDQRTRERLRSAQIDLLMKPLFVERRRR